MKPLTPIEKEQKKARDNLKIIHNGILSSFAFKRFDTWRGLYRQLGLDKGDDTKLTYPELKTFLANQATELEHKLSNNGAILTTDFKFVPSARTLEHEQSDCTVFALSSILEIPYKDAHHLLSIEGRKDSKGFRADWLSEFLLDIGFELVGSLDIKLIDWLKTNQPGKFYVRTNDHAFAIIDGVVHDYSRPKSSIVLKRIYKYTKNLNPDWNKATHKIEFPISKPINVGPAPPQVTQPTQPDQPKVEKSTNLTADNNYGYKPSPNQSSSFHPYWHQKKATVEILKKIDEGKAGILLLAGTGTGKTPITYMVVRDLLDRNYHEGRTWSHIPYLILTKSTIVEQHTRTANKWFNISPADCEITNIETLRSKSGQLWVQEQTKIVGGEEKTEWVWKKNIHPCVILLDESQGAKNKKAKQSQIIYSYNNIPKNACLISISATPFTRVIEAKAFAVSTHRPIDHLGFPKGTLLTNETWNAYASIIASPSKPDEYNQAAVERLMKDLEDWVVRVRGVKPQFDPINRVRIVQFKNAEQKQFYDEAIERFLKEKAKLDAAKEMGDSAGVCYLVILLKFAMAAEYLHAEHIADDMYNDVTHRGKAAVAAVKFKQTLIQIVSILNTKYGVSRSNISLIWGGGQTALTKKQKAKNKIKDMADKLKEMGIEVDEMLSDTGLEDVDDRILIDLPEHLRLGPQDQSERQKEIDNFNKGKTLYCLYTLKAGGVGLSLPHSDEWTIEKCRRKESGYAFEEDIYKIPVKPRTTKCTVSYNAIELVQGVGRVPRLTSLSVTEQDICCFAGTVEMDMGRIYSAKLRCLSSVVKQKEDWNSIIFGGANRQAEVDKIIEATKSAESDESSIVDEGEQDEEENGE